MVKKSKYIIFEATQKCNLNCRYCYNVWKAHTYPQGELGKKETLSLIERIFRETHFQLFTISGGEPLLREDIIDIILATSLKGAQVNLITNATVIEKSFAKDLVKAGVNLFEIPLLSAKKETHNYLTRSESFESTLRGIDFLRAANANIVIAFVATKVNIGEIPKVIKYAKMINARGVMINRFNAGGEGLKHMEELLPSQKSIIQALSISNKMAEELSIPISVSVPIQPCIAPIEDFKNLSFGYCSAGGENSYFTVDPLGNLRICNHSSTILGNLREESFKNLVNSKFSTEFFAARPQECEDCNRVSECQGGCKAAAFEHAGSLTAIDPLLSQRKHDFLRT